MKFIEKLRNLPESKKIIIFFVVMGIAALATGFIGMRLIMHDLSKVKDLGDSVQLPKIEIPDALKNLGVTKNETADWKTYTNTKYGFEIKYPKDWLPQENIMSLEYSLIFCLNNKDGCAGKVLDVKNQHEDGPTYLFTYKKDPKPSNPIYHYLGLSPKGEYYYLFSEFSKNEAALNGMISTFKFTN